MAKFVDIKLRGLPQTNRALRGLGPKGNNALAKALFAEATDILNESKEKQVPVDFGALRDSGDVDLPKTTIGGTFVEIFFGGPSAPYALVQHENLTFGHTVGKAKYLEDPFNVAQKGLDRRVASRIRSSEKAFR